MSRQYEKFECLRKQSRSKQKFINGLRLFSIFFIKHKKFHLKKPVVVNYCDIIKTKFC